MLRPLDRANPDPAIAGISAETQLALIPFRDDDPPCVNLDETRRSCDSLLKPTLEALSQLNKA